jgi:hypothetical protein
VTVFPQCFRCKHRFGDTYTCEAFPHAPGIPEEILTNEHDHTKPFDGDHGVRFEAKDPVPTGTTK